MKSYLYLFIIFLFISNCTLNKVIKYHGVHFLEKKQLKLSVNISNKDDIIQLLGPPSTKGNFDKDLWIYLERTTSSSKLSALGGKKLLKNNILILEINNKGLLTEKIFLDKNDMNELEFSKSYTQINMTKRSFIYGFLSSMRKKINDPMGKKTK
tara:strand:+ start:1101 stop:1562 length:462 start_codon:yes stop_codon:yes gene_type:complete